MTTEFVKKSMMGGALGAVAPYVLFALFGSIILTPLIGPEDANGIVEGMSIIMTLVCIPTIIIGAIFGGLSVWLVAEFEKPKWIFIRLEQSQGTRMIFNIAFVTSFVIGFFMGPILAMSFFAIWIYSLK